MVFPFATPDDFAKRLQESLKHLRAWRYEASLPWADPELTLVVALSEIGTLGHWRAEAPADMHEAVDQIVEHWESFAIDLKAMPPKGKR